MEYMRRGDQVLIRLDPGDEVCTKILEVCIRENIVCAGVTGIGAGDRAEIGLYDLSEKAFHGSVLMEPFEIVSITGNVTRMKDVPYCHLHTCVGTRDGRAMAGHLKSCRISATAEIFLLETRLNAGRMYDPVTGLNVLRFP